MAAKTTSQSRVIHDKQLIDRRTVKSSETRETFEVRLSIPTTISYHREADPSSLPLDTDTHESIKSIFIHLLSGYALFLPTPSTPLFFHSARYPIVHRSKAEKRKEEEGGGRERERWDSRIDPGKMLVRVRWRRRSSRERVNEQKSTDRGTVPRALDPGPHENTDRSGSSRAL